MRKKASQKLIQFQNSSANEKESAERAANIYLERAEQTRDLSRTLVHIDMDAFYANVEMRDNPELANKPMAVGCDSMLSTSNYMSRKFGVRAGMPGFIAKELCPNLIIIPCHFEKYREVSNKVMKIISQYDSNYLAMSLDEAYLDITDYLKNKRNTLASSKRTFHKYYGDSTNETITFNCDADGCVEEIRHRIYLETNLTASAGIACNMRLAKLCSDLNKPNGQYNLPCDNVDDIIKFISTFPIRKMNGIGPITALMLDCYDIKVCNDIYEKRSLLYMLETRNNFEFLMQVVRGLGSNRIVHESDKKSLGHET
jgi:DNA polymerase kappa